MVGRRLRQVLLNRNHHPLMMTLALVSLVFLLLRRRPRGNRDAHFDQEAHFFLHGTLRHYPSYRRTSPQQEGRLPNHEGSVLDVTRPPSPNTHDFDLKNPTASSLNFANFQKSLFSKEKFNFAL